MPTEVEIRCLLESEERAIVTEQLEGRGFVHERTEDQNDIILDYPDGRMFRSGMKLRLRVTGRRATLTYKGSLLGDDAVSVRDEIELDLIGSQSNDVIKLFSRLGVTPVLNVNKRREIWVGKGISVTFDEWPILGCVMEVEGHLNEIVMLAREVAPNQDFRNYRLVELFEVRCSQEQKSLARLQQEYEEETGLRLGQLELLLS